MFRVKPSRRRCPLLRNAFYSVEHISCPSNEWPLHPLCPSILFLSLPLSLFCCPQTVFIHPLVPFPAPILPCPLCLSHVLRCGKHHVLFSPQCSVGCQYRRWTPSRQLCLCWALWFTVQGQSPQTGNLWKLPFWQPSPQVSPPPEANRSTETGNEGTSYTSLLCAVVNHWPRSPLFEIFNLLFLLVLSADHQGNENI